VGGNSLSKIAFVPRGEFVAQEALGPNAYADPAMWLSRPGMAACERSARWLPPGAPAPDPAAPAFAVFFVHPTSYLEQAHWNAPLGDAEARGRARAVPARDGEPVRPRRMRSGRRAIARRRSARS
jgi:hypothetical protein